MTSRDASTNQSLSRTGAPADPGLDAGLGTAPPAAHALEFSGRRLDQFGAPPDGARQFVWSYVQSRGRDALTGCVALTDRHALALVIREYPSVGRTIELPTSQDLGIDQAEARLIHAGPPSAGLTAECFRLYRRDKPLDASRAAAAVRLVPRPEIYAFLKEQSAAGILIDPNIFAALYHFGAEMEGPGQPRALPAAELSMLKAVADRHAADRRILHDGYVFQIIEADGQEYARRKRGACAAIVLTITANREVVLVEQVRPPLQSGACRGLTIECPAGMVGDSAELAGEDPAAAGIREVIEEAGFKPKFMQTLLICPSTPALSNEMLVFMLAEQAEPAGRGGGRAEEGEAIRRHVVALDCLPGFLTEQEQLGKLVDPKIYTALQLLRLREAGGQG